MAVANTRVVNGINTRVLHNKDYVEVAERIRIVHELKKDFEVIESAPLQFADRCIWRVVILVDGKRYIGNAEAKLNAPKNSPDGTNPFECAETSALGRALAFAGLGTVESIASYDEIARSRPFEAVIEPAHDQRVIEAGNAPKQLAAPQQPELSVDELKALCDEICGPTRWNAVKATLFPPEVFGDLPDELLSAGQKLTVYQALDQRQRKKQQKVG